MQIYMYVHTRERDSRPGFDGVKIKLLVLLLYSHISTSTHCWRDKHTQKWHSPESTVVVTYSKTSHTYTKARDPMDICFCINNGCLWALPWTVWKFPTYKCTCLEIQKICISSSSSSSSSPACKLSTYTSWNSTEAGWCHGECIFFWQPLLNYLAAAI